MDLAYIVWLEAKDKTRKYSATVCYPSVGFIIMKQYSQETRCWNLYSEWGVKELENKKQPRL